MKQNKNNLTCHLWKIPGIRIRKMGKEEINGINRKKRTNILPFLY